MTKFIMLALAMLSICFELNAQRIKNENVKVAYNRLPDQPLSKDFTTYSASVLSYRGALADIGLTPNDMVKKHFKLRAFEQLPKGGHFHINAFLDRFKVESVEVKKSESTTTDKEGNKKKVTQYYREIIYRMPITMTVEDKDGNILEQKLYNSPSEGMKFQFLKKAGLKYNSRAELDKAWNKGKATYTKIRKEAINKAFTEFSKMVRDKYDTQVTSSIIQLKVPTGKKVANADEFEAQALKAKEILKGIKADAPLGSVQNELQPMLDFWDDQKGKFSASDKKQRKVHHACLFNLAAINLYLENFEAAQKYASAAVDVGEKKMVTKELLGRIEPIQKKMNDQGVSTLHFPIDLSSAVAPEGADYSHLSEPPAVEEAPDNSSSYDGYYITTRGDSIRGTYVFRDGKDKSPSLHSGGNTRFVFEKDGEEIKWYVSPENFKRGGFNGRKFTVIKRKPPLSVRSISFAHEVIEDGPKMKLIRVFPMETKKDGSGVYAQTLISIKGEEGYLNVGDVTVPRFVNWRKGFAQLFEDCEVLYAEIRVGEYERDLGSISEAVRVYNANDCE